MKTRLIILLGLLLMFSAFTSERQVITIFTIGDSTMANKSLEGGNPERGWGQMLSRYFSEDIVIDNHAVNGRSSKSFIDEGRWDKVLAKLKTGDYVFIQFGHNDEKPDEKRHTDPGTTFDANLKRFVEEARAKGAIPVLFNSIVRRNFGEANADAVAKAVVQDDMRTGVDPNASQENTQMNAKLIDTHGAYLDSPRNVARELEVPFVDLNRVTHNLVEQMGPEASKQLFVWVAPNTVPALPKGREDNTHLNVCGAATVAWLAVQEVIKVVPALKPYVRHYDFVVAKDGSGDFFSVQEAINAVPDFRKNVRTTILVKQGVYKEKIVIPASKINLSLTGEDGAILSYDDYADKPNRFGEKTGTSGSASCYIYAPDFYAENITFENTTGPVGQAVACFVSADRVYFKNCRFLGWQDTLYTYGKGCRQYYEDCYIEGTVDFIFGWSTAVFNRCHIHNKTKGYVTAPSTDQGQKYGYVFYDCRLTASEGVTDVYLSRPWRPYAQAVFVRCDLGGHILPAGWDNWGKKEAERTVFYAEYQSRGAGAAPQARASFSHQLHSLEGFAMEDVLAGTDGWNPVANGNALLNIKR
ncbi:pectinesterase family protein [uncultured Bacteroides sp.]|uniref:pectinesterase family protein n=1 Tax=uncultured Bacteroides sp. TaxID=162156 RepID=UPI00260DCED8|nr:pectinesterase family protein [uncultured Bacteroides sp.]